MARRFNSREIDRGFRKLERLNEADPSNGLNLRSGKEHFGWYLVDGNRAFFASSKKGTGTVGPGRAHKLAKYLRITLDEFADLCDCRMTGPQYHQRIVEKLAAGTLELS